MLFTENKKGRVMDTTAIAATNATTLTDITTEKPRILAIDDQQVNLDTLKHLFHADYEVLTTNDGDEGIRLARALTPDLILLDILMPAPDGYTVLRELKESALTRDIPIIIISGSEEDDAEEKGLLLGAVDYIAKPIRPVVVKARIRTHLENARLRNEVARLDLNDVLTGIASMRNFEIRMKIEWAHAVREKAPLSLLFIEVDNFRVYNEQFGHPQGDELLKEVARTLSQTIKRASDLVARVRGKLFGVLLWNTDAQAATVVATKIQDAIAEMVVPTISNTWTATTASIGLASKIPEPMEKVESLAKEAINRLATAREAGGDRLMAE
jgi:diguanylate cyclase (GGDEF)-like protein